MIDFFVTYWWVIFGFFTIALLYSSVGFGGGSSYLALLALTPLLFIEIRSISLLCNIAVVTGGTYIFAKSGHFNWKKIVPLVTFSVPMAFIGGYLKISQSLFFILLGFSLLIASLSMFLNFKNKLDTDQYYKKNSLRDAFFGGSIGLLSGMVGIGGGIFLAPLLHLTKWDTSKKIAATASFFILVNSISGLLGQITNPEFSINYELTLVLLITVFIGGQIGSRIGAKLVSQLFLKKATAVLIAYIAFTILSKYL
ncbi:MAG: sulfite exporter TauE/SafE family protein [Flavobacteriaceae bacterium]|nr:sulfite exporter TauE/SafE family protein [Flavobacteriaceae bacterium]